MGWLGTWFLPERCTHNPLVLTFSPSSCQRLLFLSALVCGSARAWLWLATTEPFPPATPHIPPKSASPSWLQFTLTDPTPTMPKTTGHHHQTTTQCQLPTSPLRSSNAFCFLSETRYPTHITLMPASALHFPSFGSMDIPLAQSLHHHLLLGGSQRQGSGSSTRGKKDGKQQRHKGARRSSGVRGEKRA